jgi:hypothetical protein
MQNEFLLTFDIPKESNTLRVRIFRNLIKLNAKLIHHSLWKSENLKELMSIANEIKRNGGTARILEEKFIF